MDASDIGVGAVLSQRFPSDNKTHPSAFFSRRLSPAERNYDVGDRELLAIKLALEEWRHWLEGTSQPFLVWTDHKNLEYIRTAKRLNPRQARWSLFFNRFNFCLSYCPGSKNIKPDALSRQFEPESSPQTPATILPSTCFVGVLRWEVQSEVLRALDGVEVPKDLSCGKAVCPSSSPGLCHPVGPYLQAHLPPGSESDYQFPHSAVLVAHHEKGGE